MKQRYITVTVMILFSFACVLGCTGFFSLEDNPNEYEKAIEQFEYQLGYVNMYSSGIVKDAQTSLTPDINDDKKIVYLTFDDGPSERTTEILDILDEYDIKATFFIISSDKAENEDILRRIHSEGHTIGVHSASHSYKEIYRDVDSFLSDFEICYNYIADITGEEPEIFRFPGGSVNSYNKAVYKDIINEMNRRGFTYFDWNVSSDDATKNSDENSIYTKVMSGCSKRSSSVVLMHDSATKKDTVAALKRIIPDLLEQGYTFDSLNSNVKPTVFKIE